MLINFSVGNFLSFKEKQTLFLTAIKPCRHRLAENTFADGRENLLKTVAVYGANASGKTKLLEAIAFFRSFVLSSASTAVENPTIQRVPFLLDLDSKNKPSFFEMEFMVGRTTRYRYGFEVSETEVVREWLFSRDQKPRAREKQEFLRQTKSGSTTVDVVGLEKAKGLESRTRNNVLFLSVCSQFAVEQAVEITNWILRDVNTVAGGTPESLLGYTINAFQLGEARQNEINAFLRNADTGVQALRLEPSEKGMVVKAEHRILDADGVEVGSESFPLGTESEGTKKLFALSGPILDTLDNGRVLFVDELDARLHPNLTARIIELFNSSRTNPKNAQLVFNTHDVNLLKQFVYNPETKKQERLLRRDQIYFVEKDNCDASRLYSFSDFRQEKKASVRNDASLEKEYLAGEYGAVPSIRELTGEYHAAD